MMTIHKEQEKNTVAKLVIRINLQKYPPILLRINRLTQPQPHYTRYCCCSLHIKVGAASLTPNKF